MRTRRAPTGGMAFLLLGLAALGCGGDEMTTTARPIRRRTRRSCRSRWPPAETTCPTASPPISGYTGAMPTPAPGAPGTGIPVTRSRSGTSTRSGAPTLADSIIIPMIGIVSDVEVSADGTVLMFSAERGANEGLYLYDLSDPVRPGVSGQRPGAERPAHRDVRRDRRPSLCLRRPQPAGPGAPHLRRHRSRGHRSRGDRSDPSGLRHPRHLRPGWPRVRVRLELRCDHL